MFQRHGFVVRVAFVGLIATAMAVVLSSPVLAEPVSPWGSDLALDPARPPGEPPVLPGDIAGLQAGADQIVDQQCPDGGWGWPHDTCTTTYHNITGPIALGLLDAYPLTGDAAHLASAVAGGDFDLLSEYPTGNPRFGSFTAYFMWRLSEASGDSTYSDFAATEFFDALDAGTYGPDGDWTTADFVTAVQAARAGAWINLLPWEFSTLTFTATQIGNAGQDAVFQDAILDGLDTLDSTDPGSVYADLLGLAGGIRGLALIGVTTFDPINAPNCAAIDGIDNLGDLADVLVSFQNVDGSWNWHSAVPAPTEGDKDTQNSAYAVMALAAADPLLAADYSAAIVNGRTWLWSMQLPSGGFLSYPGGDENTEVEGEALSALAAPMGACCAVAGSCSVIEEAECTVAGGSYLGDGTACEGDADSDGVDGECGDECPDDPGKTEPGICGCGTPDTDTDDDGVPDCQDGCPLDENKIEPGICGCGVSDSADDDGDGVPDCIDLCPGADDALFGPDCVSAIPTVSTWGLVVLALIVLTGAKIAFSRRRTA